jgi:hypothetical protein
MLDFVPFMILTAVVVLIVAAVGAVRSGLAAGDLEPLPEAERLFAECMAERGVQMPPIRIYRDAGSGGLVITGPGDIDPEIQEAFAVCDNLVWQHFA